MVHYVSQCAELSGLMWGCVEICYPIWWVAAGMPLDACYHLAAGCRVVLLDWYGPFTCQFQAAAFCCHLLLPGVEWIVGLYFVAAWP